eukprot:281259-Rhodomonas_salina.1
MRGDRVSVGSGTGWVYVIPIGGLILLGRPPGMPTPRNQIQETAFLVHIVLKVRFLVLTRGRRSAIFLVFDFGTSEGRYPSMSTGSSESMSCCCFSQ